MNRIKSIIMSTGEGKAKYDAVVKALLAEIQFLAMLLKRFVPEFSDVPLEDIEYKYIETVSISETEVERNRSNIEGISNEDKTLNEGNIYYDILFKVIYPETNGKSGYIGMYINIEIQNEYQVGYPLEKRAMYYAARKFSSQLQNISNGKVYRSLEKVYSIWLCIGDDVPDYEANTVTLYRTEKHDIIGSVKRESNVYDLMDVIIIRINDSVPVEDKFLKLLQTLCSNSINSSTKLETLENLGVRVTEEIKEGVDSMSGFGANIEARAAEKKAKEISLSLLEQDVPYEKIATAAKVSVETVKEWEKEEKAKE